MANVTNNDSLPHGFESPFNLGDQDTFATARQYSLSDLQGVMRYERSNTEGLEEFPRADGLLAGLHADEEKPRENRQSEEVKNEETDWQRPEPPPPPPRSQEEIAHAIIQLLLNRLADRVQPRR